MSRFSFALLQHGREIFKWVLKYSRVHFLDFLRERELLTAYEAM